MRTYRHWTTRDIEGLAAMWADGVTVVNMAHRFGVTVCAIQGLIKRHAEKFPARPRTRRLLKDRTYKDGVMIRLHFNHDINAKILRLAKEKGVPKTRYVVNLVLAQLLKFE